MITKITSWADEYDSDMDEEWNSNIYNNNQQNNETINEEYVFSKFSDKICEKKCNINYKLFNIVDNSRYSCLMPWYVSQVNGFLNEIYKKGYFNNNINKIVDVGANIGVDSINFIINFPESKLFCFEIEKKTYKALCKNLIEFKNITKLKSIEELNNNKSKVQAFNKDFLKSFDILYDTDIVFIDAPWGGSIYKDKSNVSIYLQSEDDYFNMNNYDSSKNIIIITKNILKSEYKVKSILLKVPYNYEFNNFEKEIYKINNNIEIKYKKIYKGNTSYIAFVLIAVYYKTLY
jgi:hypothetical protein